jgi:alkyl hydroperoxide reductase subunit D
MSMHPTAEQLALLKKLASGQDYLTGENLLYCAWASALNSQSTFVVEQVSALVAKPNAEQQRAISLAISRMGVTNPYFISRQLVNVMAGGSLNDLGFSPLSALNVANETAYHYACIVISLMNGGHPCLNSHVHSLRAAGETEQAIDAAMRLAAICSSLAKSQFALNTVI